MVDLLCMGEPMLEFNQLPQTDGRRLYLEGHGGDTSNAAIAAARQGVRAGYITAIGTDAAGDSFMRLWSEEQVDTSTVRRFPDHPTAVYFVTHTPTEGHQFTFYRGGSAASAYTPDDLPESAIAAARILYVSGISQAISASAADAVFAAIAIARRHGVRVAYDTNYRPRLWPPRRAGAVIHAGIAQADIALPGLEDAQILTGLTDPDAILDFYLGLGPAVVVLKMGSAGAYLAAAGRRRLIPPFPCRALDATGAGDTFCGSFLARLILGDSPEAAAQYAGVAAALSTNGYGAVAPIPRAEEVIRAAASLL